MAVELAHAYVTIIPSLKGIQEKVKEQVAPVGPTVRDSFAKGVSEGLSALGGKIQSVGGNISSLGSQLTSKLTMPIAGAAVAAGGLVATLGWKRLVSVDTAQAQLKGLGYTAEDVDRISGDLRVALEDGMLTMGEATSAAAAGLAAGVDEGDELIRYIGLLDNAVAGSSGTFDEMNQIFSRVQGSGKLMTNELQMIEQRMPGFTAAMADSFGVTREELEKMVTAGEVSSDEFLDVMDGFAGGTAAAMSESWEGMASNTKAWIAIIGESLLSGVFEESKESLAEFLQFLQSDEVQTWAAETGEAIGRAFSDMLEKIRDVINWWQNLDDSHKEAIGSIIGIAVAIGPALVVVGKLVTGIGGLVSVAGKITGAMGGGSAAMRILGGAVRFLLGPWGLLIGAIVGMVASSPELQGALLDLAKTIGGALLGVVEALMPIFEELATAILPVVSEVLGLVAGLIADTLVPIIIELVEQLTPLIESLMEMLVPILEACFEVVLGLVEFAIPPLIAIFEFLFDVIQTVFDAIGPIIEAALTIVQGIIDTVTAVITGDWEGAWEGIKTIFSGVWDLIKGIITGAIDIVKSVITGGLDLIQGAWDTVWGAISGFFSDIWDDITSAASGFFNGVKEKFTELTDYVGEIPDKIMEFFTGIGDWLVDSGKALLDGFIDGITEGFDKAKGWVSGKLGDLRDLFPFSPAKEGPFSGRGWVAYSGESMGETFMRSIADSLHDGKSDVVDELSDISDEFDSFSESQADIEIELLADIGRAIRDGFDPSNAPAAIRSEDMNSRGVNIENVTIQAADNRFSVEELESHIEMRVG